MKIKEIMERAGTNQTGRAIAYIKDALDEMNILAETHITTQRIDITADQRFYDLPSDCLKVIDMLEYKHIVIRCKHYNNEDEKYRSIPRSIYKPEIVDEDGN